MEDLQRLLRRLSETAGPSGAEVAVAAILEEAWSPRCDQLRRDAVGSVYGLVRCAADDAPTLALVAHLDEVGLIVTRVDERGFLRVAALGGVDRRQLLGELVTVHGRQDLPGLVGTRPPHLLAADERRKYPPVSELWIDVGLPPEAAVLQVRPGDPVTLRRDVAELGGGLLCGKAMDNRAGVAALHAALGLLQERRRRCHVVFAATAQEEVGLRGATALVAPGAQLWPAAALAVDTGFAKQPGVGEGEGYELGKGPVIARGPNVHPRIHELLIQATRDDGVPYQEEVIAASSGTDAWALQVAREGTPTGVVSIPIRYMHSPVEVVDVEDVRQTGRLLAAFAAHFTAEGLTCRLK